MINPYQSVDWNPSAGKIRRTLAVIALFLLVAGLVLWKKNVSVTGLKYGSSVFPILLAGAVFPAIGKWLCRLWFGLACAIGFCVSNLILLICFYGVMTPLALIRRMLGSQPLPLKEQKDSGWIEHEREMDPAGYFRQF